MRDFRDRASRVLDHCKSNFGEPCLWYPNTGGAGRPITGIFDNVVTMVDVDTEELITAQQPTLGINLFDFTHPEEIKKGDLIMIRNVIYRITEKRLDGQAGATLFLHQQNHEQKVFKKKASPDTP